MAGRLHHEECRMATTDPARHHIMCLCVFQLDTGSSRDAATIPVTVMTKIPEILVGFGTAVLTEHT